MFDAAAPVYDYWLQQIHVMADRAVPNTASAQLYAPVYNLAGQLEGEVRTHPFREAFDQRRREFKRRWIETE
jgi:hypothetical protein